MFGTVTRKLNFTRLLPKATKRREELREQRRVGREHFIPVRPNELIDELVSQSEFTSDEAYQFRSLCSRLETTFHNESRQLLSELQDVYAAVNPDLDTESLADRVTELEREVAVSEMFEHLCGLLERANFKQLTREDVERAIGDASALGVRLDVDLTRFDQLAVFARGCAVVSISQRTWQQWWYRTVDIDIPMYQRLVVVFRLKATDVHDESVKAAYLRLFKNVPQQDIDMLLPGGKVRISLLDRGKILVPTISGVGLATFKLGLLFFAGIYGLLKIAGLIGGALGSGWKSVNGYRKTKDKYELNLTRNLYYQNLDNNAGVLLRLSTEAERQELREAVLGYFVLLKANKPCTTREVAKLAEATLLGCGIDVDYEVADALTKMVRLELCSRTSMGCWVALPLDKALRAAMTRNLQEVFSAGSV